MRILTIITIISLVLWGFSHILLWFVWGYAQSKCEQNGGVLIDDGRFLDHDIKCVKVEEIK